MKSRRHWPAVSYSGQCSLILTRLDYSNSHILVSPVGHLSLYSHCDQPITALYFPKVGQQNQTHLKSSDTSRLSKRRPTFVTGFCLRTISVNFRRRCVIGFTYIRKQHLNQSGCSATTQLCDQPTNQPTDRPTTSAIRYSGGGQCFPVGFKC